MVNNYLEAYVDGGCFRNGKPDAEAYGSFKVLEAEHEVMFWPRFVLSEAYTNNEAEWYSLEKLITYLSLYIIKHPGIKFVNIYTDSQLVASQFNGYFRIKKPKLKEIHDLVKEKLDQEEFRNVKISLRLVPRDIIFEKLGH